MNNTCIAFLIFLNLYFFYFPDSQESVGSAIHSATQSLVRRCSRIICFNLNIKNFSKTNFKCMMTFYVLENT